MNATVDRDLLKLVRQHVNTLKRNAEQLTFEVQEDRERVSQALKDISTSLEELKARVASLGREQKVIKLEQSSLSKKMDTLETSTQVQFECLKSQQENVQQRVAHVEAKLNSAFDDRGKYSEGFIRLTLYVSVFNLNRFSPSLDPQSK